jgi:dihydrofolate reductase/thymidylate synthase
MVIKLIACIDENNGIGYQNNLPWSLPEDLTFFQKNTTNQTIIMGKNTFNSLPIQPLPRRTNIVISSSLSPSLGVSVFSSLNDALCSPIITTDDIYIIGGSQLYSEALFSCIPDELLITQIYDEFKCDTFFPELPPTYQLSRKSAKFTSSSGLQYKYLTYIRKHQEYQYHDLLKTILHQGIERSDRTNVGTKSLFGLQMRFDLSKEFPLLTTKRVPFKTVIKELLWIINGDTNAKHLQEQNVRIWNDNTTREFLDNRGLQHLPEGDIGEMYGHQWRHWGSQYIDCNTDYTRQGIDQLSDVINDIKSNPTSRRHIVTALNPSSYDNSCLLPCHTMFQFYVDTNKHTLSCHLYQRSGDMFLGIPFNIASYSALTCMVAKLCDLTPGTFIHTIGDTHIYLNHVEQVQTQLSRVPYPFPQLYLKNCDSIDDFTLEDFELINYQSHPSIKAPMAI